MRYATERPHFGRYISTTLLAGLALSGCSNESDNPVSAFPEITAVSASIDTVTEKSTFTFDDLGGVSSIIQVYPGVSESATDKAFNGIFSNGQVVGAICKTLGRTVRSHTELGEREVQSDQWVKVVGSPGLAQFATLTYGEVSPDKNGLPECNSLKDD